jgi:hypothetical protein
MKLTPAVFAVVAVVSLAWLGASAAVPADMPSYEVFRTVTPIAVDGVLSDASWAAAKTINFVRNLDGGPSPYPTEAKILYDDKFIYFGFRCVDSNIWSTMKKRDEHLWEEEVVEVFLKPSASNTGYIELEVNPLGTLIDIYLVDVRKAIPYASWNSEKIAWAVHVDGTVDGKPGDREWTCEMALPMEDVVPAAHVPPQEGDRWGLNLYRVEKRPKPADLAWSPTMKEDFHVPAKFGTIVFSAKPVQ